MCLGEQLESIHQSRQRAQAAYDLMDYYNQFSKGDVSKLEALRKERGREKEGREKVATICRRLNALAKEIDMPGADKVRYIRGFVCFPPDMRVDTREHRPILREV